MRKLVLAALTGLLVVGLMTPSASATVPVEWLESGGTLFVGGGTALSNGVFFPGTVIYDGDQFQGLPPLQLKKGTDLDFVNLDVSAVTNSHQIVSFKRKRGNPVFSSESLDGPGTTVVITSHLKPGVYPFFCTTHFGMYGRLEIVP
ncbi:MAG TPA: plastocyanin/azurin family copper-binding protein [Actinomycetota bacterium]|nr:plastocyanin/azurin family copper-binding protein [Actinomycetota bacterium]